MFRQLFTICLVALIMSVSADTDPTTVAPDVKPVTVPTKPPTTSTPVPTTVAPVTTTVAPVTTTVAPVTTTVEPVTTVAPQPLPPFPEPTQGNWSFSDPNTKQTCIILQFALQLNLTYNTADKKSNNVLYNIPSNATVASGSCANETDSIVLQWSGSNSLNLTFEKNVTASRYDLASLQIKLNASTLFNQTDDQIALFYKQPNTFVTPVKFSYYCNHEQVLNLTASAASNETVATLALNHVHLEAFHEASSVSYSTAKDCDAIDTPDIVPIAVGCALAALVVVVLIAYLVGRRRAQNRGYLSM